MGGAPTTIRQYGTGVASIGTFDINGNGIWVSAAASGSASDANIQYVNDGYGMSMQVDAGANTSAGDFTINGSLSVTNLGFYKRGTGSLLLNGAATTSNVALQHQAGTVITGINNAIGTNAALNISSGAKLIVNGTSQTVANLSNSGTITGGSATLSTVTVSGSSATAASSGTLGGTGTNENNLALAVSGSGILTLSGTANTYAGGTTVNGGTLRVTNASGSATGTGAVTVNLGGTLDGTGTISGTVNVSAAGGTVTAGVSGAGNLTAGNLTFNGPGTVNVVPGVTRVNVTGTLTASGTANSVSINIGTTPFAAGTYHLISHAGSIVGFSAFKLGTNPGGAYSYTLVDNAGYLDLQVATSAIFWTGSTSSEWSTNAGVLNWVAGSTPTFYSDGNDVIFNDSATTTTVDVSVGNLAPGSMQFNNTTKDFTVGGSMAVGGTASLLKTGTGKLTINNVNSFTGAVTVNAGTLSVGTIADGGSNSALGAGTGIVLGGGTLSYTGGSASSNRTVTANTASTANTLDVPNGPLTLTGVVGGTGVLTKTGADTLILGNAANTVAGITINGGTVSVDAVAKLGAGTLAAGGGTLALEGSTAMTMADSLTLNTGGGTVQVDDTAGVNWTGAITGTGGMHKTGSGTLTITGNKNFSGGVTVDSGTLLIGAGTGGWYINPFGQYNLITINAGAKLQTTIVHALGTDSNSVFINGGTLQLASGQYISTLHMAGGLITGGNVSTFGNTMVFDASATGSVIACPFNCYPSTQPATLQVADGAAATDLLISGYIHDVGNLIKTGAGTLDLGGMNTYVGNTTVNAGTLHLLNTGKLTFVLGATSGTTNAVTGTGTVIFDGAFAIDTTAAAALTTGSWVIDTTTTLAASYGSTFTVTNPDGSLWTNAGGGKWTKTVGVKIWTFNTATGTLTVAGNGFAGWAATHAGGQTATQDYDGDGVSNGLEWVLGGNETTNDIGKLPTGTIDSLGNLVFTFVRDQQILTDSGTTVQIQVGTDLAGWTETYTVGVDTASSTGSPGATGTVTVTPNTPVSGKDTITLTEPQGADAKKFARLQVLITP